MIIIKKNKKKQGNRWIGEDRGGRRTRQGLRERESKKRKRWREDKRFCTWKWGRNVYRLAGSRQEDGINAPQHPRHPLSMCFTRLRNLRYTNETWYINKITEIPRNTLYIITFDYKQINSNLLIRKSTASVWIFFMPICMALDHPFYVFLGSEHRKTKAIIQSTSSWPPFLQLSLFNSGFMEFIQ